MLRRALVHKEISGSFFGFYTPDEIRKISVLQLTNPQTWDTLNQPQKGGLYDPALGPLDQDSRCATCGLTSADCPGHLGHIELAFPIYNPVLIKMLFSILKAKCHVCHHFMLAENEVMRFCDKLRALDRGDLQTVMNMETAEENAGKAKAAAAGADSKPAPQKKPKKKRGRKGAAGSDDSDEEEDADEMEVEPPAAESKKREVTEPPVFRSHEIHIGEYRRRITKKFFLVMRGAGKKCGRCGAPVPPLKLEKRTKIFRKPLSAKAQETMAQLGMSYEVVVPMGKSEQDALETEDTEAGIFKTEGRRSKQEKKAAQGERDVKAAAKGKRTAAAARGDTVDEDDEEDADELEDEEEEKKVVLRTPDGATARKYRYLTVPEVRQHMRLLYQKEHEIVSLIFGQVHQNAEGPPVRVADPNIFFMDVIAVPPSRFRPLNKSNGRAIDHPQNIYLGAILRLNKELYTQAKSEGAKDFTRILSMCLQLQVNVNFFYDNKDAPPSSKMPAGVVQILEKKEGLLRRNVMGKRVNFAARTVISPDCFIQTNEIGIPLPFALKLTYPQPVNERNFHELEQAVKNGPLKWPGATSIEDENGNVIVLDPNDAEKREADSKLLRYTASSSPAAVKKVYRHIRDGDVVLLNRQPTLHKPGVMAMLVRVLKAEKTLRMHYSNCSTFNADFDGDEMNIHFPQDEISRAEAYNIALSDYQYISPRHGAPLRGLIQDHIGTGVLLTKRDTFFNREEFQQLVYAACLEVNSQHPIEIPPPFLQKPVRLWSGKQVIGAVLNQLTVGKIGINLDSKSKVPDEMWGKDSYEVNVVIRNNELLCGTLEKNQYGASAYGLVHAAYEILGGRIAGQILSTLGRLFTMYLQQTHGFTCGIDDMILKPGADAKRRELLANANSLGHKVAAEFTGKAPDDSDGIKSTLGVLWRVDKEVAALDGLMKQNLHKVTSQIIETCIPSGQVKKFPENGLSLMTVSGAKGSVVNFSQISCLLGQQELEGRRVPLMVSGRTLPCFMPYDTSARAGGYVMDRFLTGLRQPEYYFHCMAGREGLIDTAVKTSRSGYLQRCLIKHLESLHVRYDLTVRDSDGSVLQFYYGDDALDPLKTPFLNKFKFFAQNYDAAVELHKPQKLPHETGHVKPGQDSESLPKSLNLKRALKYHKKVKKDKTRDPVMSFLDPSYDVGCVTERFQNELMDYIEKNPDGLLKTEKNPNGVDPYKFASIMYMKYRHSLAHPGEAVGIVAAQSIGEPSTQMTLNTFHLAGQGDRNVTLGIPRLREIIMTASKTPSTPEMILPLVEALNTEEEARQLARRLYRLCLKELIIGLTIREVLDRRDNLKRAYRVEMRLKKPEEFGDKYLLTYKELRRVLEQRYLTTVIAAVVREMKKQSLQMSNRSTGPRKKATVDTDEPFSESKEDAEDGAADNQRARKAEYASYGNEEAENSERREVDKLKKRSTKQKKRQQQVEGDELEEQLQGEGDEAAGSRTAAEQQAAEDGDEGDDDEELALDEDEAEELAAELRQARLDEEPEEPVMTAKQREEFEEARRKVHDPQGLLDTFFFDEKHATFSYTLKLPPSNKKLLMIALTESVCSKFFVKEVPRISRCFVNKQTKGGKTQHIVQTDGVNFRDIWQFQDVVDINRIHSNDIWAIRQTYGVEAARAAIATEIANVFNVYGIAVDPRHLGIVADYQTFEGGYKPFNRMGMEANASPWQKMSFETTMQFMKAAALHGEYDDLRSSSAALVFGKVVPGGTGLHEIFAPVDLG